MGDGTVGSGNRFSPKPRAQIATGGEATDEDYLQLHGIPQQLKRLRDEMCDFVEESLLKEKPAQPDVRQIVKQWQCE